MCRDSLYGISDQIQVLDDIPCSVGDIESQISEVEVNMMVVIHDISFCDVLLNQLDDQLTVSFSVCVCDTKVNSMCY